MWEWLSSLGDSISGWAGGASDWASGLFGDATRGASDSLSDVARGGAGIADPMGEGAVGSVIPAATGDPAYSVASHVAGAGGRGAGDWASTLWQGAKDTGSGLGAVAKGALPFASLGATGFGIASQLKAQGQAAENAKQVKRSLDMQERAAVPLTNFGESQLRDAQAGKVPPAVQAQIDQWAQGAKVKARDYLARAGIGDSSAAAQWEAYIDQQAEAMKTQALQSESQQGVDALGKGAGVAAGVGNQAGQQQGSLEKLIQEANQQLMRLSGAAA